MSTPFYIIRYTDPAKLSFVVNTATTNGPITPSTTALGPLAVSANTSLDLLGRAVTDYGQPIQQNMVYMLEHFAYASPPSYPVEGQIWFNNVTKALSVYDSTSWIQLQVSTGGDINANNFKVINVGTAVATTDALNLGTADSRYIRAAMPVALGSTLNVGGTSAFNGASTFNSTATFNNSVTFTNNLTLIGSGQFVLPNLPAAGNHAANKAYVDATIASVTAASGSGQLSTLGGTITGALIISSAGSVTSAGPVVISNTLNVSGASFFTSDIAVTNATLKLSGTSSLDMQSNKIHNLSAPVVGTDAVNKTYVDTVVLNGVVTSGAFNNTTGTITLTRTGTTDVVVVGAVAPFIHTHTSTAVTVNADPTYTNSYIRQHGIELSTFPAVVPLPTALGYVDYAVYNLTQSVVRDVLVGNNTSVSFATPSGYVVGSNRLQVFVDGVKQVCNIFAHGRLGFSNTTTENTNSGLLAGTAYAIKLTVNGVVHDNVTITTPATTPITLHALIKLIGAQFVTLGIPAVVIFEQSGLSIYSTVSGASSSVIIGAPTVGTDLQLTIPTTSISNSSTRGNYSYKEDGIPFDTLTPAQTFTFSTAPSAGSIIEYIILPS